MPENSTWVLPHLTQEEIADRDLQEHLLGRELDKCSHGNSFDSERAHHLMCHYAIEILKILLASYLSRPGFTAKWVNEMVYLSTYRVLTKAKDHAYRQDVAKLFQAEVEDALRKHLRDNPPLLKVLRPPPTGKQARHYAVAGIDIESGSPLLMMAHGAALQRSSIPQPPPSTLADARKAYVRPLLDAKGWSILDWANEATVAYHTAADYLDGKTNPYPSSRKKMAAALSISIQQLPR